MTPALRRFSISAGVGFIALFGVAVLNGLVILSTGLVLGVSILVAMIVGLVGFAVVKATLVALYFMHLKFERKSLGIIVASTLILGAILVSVGIGEKVLPRP